MDQDATWYGGRPRPTRHCVRCGPSYPIQNGTPTLTQVLAHVYYYGKMAGWMKTTLGTEVDLGPGHIVLDGVSAPAKGAQQPPILAHVYCGHGRPSQLLLSSCSVLLHCARGLYMVLQYFWCVYLQYTQSIAILLPSRFSDNSTFCHDLIGLFEHFETTVFLHLAS